MTASKDYYQIEALKKLKGKTLVTDPSVTITMISAVSGIPKVAPIFPYCGGSRIINLGVDWWCDDCDKDFIEPEEGEP